MKADETKKKDGFVRIADEDMEKVSGGTDSFSFADFFGDSSFNKELVDDGTGKIVK